MTCFYELIFRVKSSRKYPWYIEKNKITFITFIFWFKQLISVTSKGFVDVLHPNFSFFKNPSPPIYYHIICYSPATLETKNYDSCRKIYTRPPAAIVHDFSTARRYQANIRKLPLVNAYRRSAWRGSSNFHAATRCQAADRSFPPKPPLFVNAYRPRKHARAHLSLFFFPSFSFLPLFSPHVKTASLCRL